MDVDDFDAADLDSLVRLWPLVFSLLLPLVNELVDEDKPRRRLLLKLPRFLPVLIPRFEDVDATFSRLLAPVRIVGDGRVVKNVLLLLDTRGDDPPRRRLDEDTDDDFLRLERFLLRLLSVLELDERFIT